MAIMRKTTENVNAVNTRKFEGEKSYSLTTFETRPLDELTTRLNGLGAKVEILFDGTSKQEESFLSVHMDHAALVGVAALQQTNEFAFAIKEKTLHQPLQVIEVRPDLSGRHSAGGRRRTHYVPKI